MNDENLASYEARIMALESLCQSQEEREINQLVIRTVRAIRSTLWLINGSVKYLAGPIGLFWGVWLYGHGIWEWLAAFASGQPPK